MGQPYIGEIRLFAGSFTPAGWYSCDGSLVPIGENEALFQLIGTTYGGDGQSTFALPDLRGRVPVHQSGSSVLGQSGGVEQVTLTAGQVPAHTHALLGSTASAGSTSPSGGVPATQAEVTALAFGSDAPLTTMSAQVLQPSGGSQPHENMQPYVCLTFIISAFGIFPSPT
jgi:microcystin-dependent protein